MSYHCCTAAAHSHARRRVRVELVGAQALGLIILLAACRGMDEPPQNQAPDQTADVEVQQLGRLTLPTDFFTENLGQLSNDAIQYYHASGGIQLGFADGAVHITAYESHPSATELPTDGSAAAPQTVTGIALHIDFVGSQAVPRGVAPRDHVNHFAGPAGLLEVSSFDSVVFTDLYPGIDAAYAATPDGPKYVFEVAPGADLADLVLGYEGIESLSLSARGDLLLHTALGDIADSAPLAFDSEGTPVDCAWALIDEVTAGMRCPDWDDSLALTIDPLLSSTFLGGSLADFLRGVTVDPAGNVVVAGESAAANFPAQFGVFTDTQLLGPFDAVVASLTESLDELRWVAFVGGTAGDTAVDVAVGPAGDIYITGFTTSQDFGATIAHGPATGSEQAFVTRLDGNMGDIVYSAVVGGSAGRSEGLAVAVSDSGVAYMVGQSESTDFPLLDAFGAHGDSAFVEAFLVALETDGGLRQSTFLEQGAGSAAWSVATSGEDAFVAGNAISPAGTDIDSFVLRLSPDGPLGISYITPLTGAGFELAGGIAADDSGNAYVVGNTTSANFPSTIRLAPAANGAFDVYAVKLNGSGNFVYSMVLGGAASDVANGLTVNAAGEIILTGATDSDDVAGQGVPQAGGRDVLLTQVNAAGDGLVDVMTFGGGATDQANGVAMTLAGDYAVVGTTSSVDFPDTSGAGYGGGTSDGFVALVEGTDPPVPPGIQLTLPPDVTVQCGESTSPSATGQPTVTTDCPSGEPLVFHTDGRADGSCGGERIVTRSWVAMDDCDNEATGTQIITTVDTLGPTVIAPADVTLSCVEGTSPDETGRATASDTCSTVVDISFSDAVDAPLCPQTATLSRTWAAVDDCGNTGTGLQVIGTVDDQPPALTCPADVSVPETSPDGTPVELDPAVAEDACGIDLSVSNDAPELFPLGETVVTTQATDECGNPSFCETIVTVEAVCLPRETVDFDGLAAGTIVSQLGPVAITGSSRGGSCLATIFDSANPTGDDPDLGTPNQAFGGPGFGLGEMAGAGNDTALGNLLILAENNRDHDGDGLLDDPDDNASGGTLTLDFGGPVDLTTLTLIDIEENHGTVELWRDDTLLHEGGIPAAGDNSVQHLDLSEHGGGVTRLVVHLAGSGAIDDVSYCGEIGSCCPDESELTLTDMLPME